MTCFYDFFPHTKSLVDTIRIPWIINYIYISKKRLNIFMPVISISCLDGTLSLMSVGVNQALRVKFPIDHDSILDALPPFDTE